MELQWGHRLSAMESAQPHTGGPLPVDASMGPPPFGDGKHRRGRLPPRQKCRASMGPPPFGDGKASGCRSGCPRSGSFNGATAFRRWKGLPGPPAPHREEGFNGATAFRRWKASIKPLVRATEILLQWGHRLSAMEILITCLMASCGTVLQWGHRLSAMESVW